MSDSTRIEEIISQSALKAFDELKAKVTENVTQLETLVSTAVKLNSTFANIKTPREFSQTLKEIEQNEKTLYATSEELIAIQAKLNNATALQTQKQAINDLIIKNKELANSLKEQQLLKQKASAADLQASQEEKKRIQNELDAGREKILQKKEEIKVQEELNNSINVVPTGFTNTRAQLIKPPVTTGSGFVPGNENEQQIVFLNKNKAALEQVSIAQKQLTKDLASGVISQGEFDAKMVTATQLELEYKASIAAATAELKLQSKIDLTPDGTLARAKIENQSLIKQRDLVDPQDLAEIERLNGLIDKNNDLIDANSSKLEKQKINIGNYPQFIAAGFKTLNTELAAVQAKISSGKFSGAGLEQLKKQEVALVEATAVLSGEITTNSSAILANSKAAKILGEAYTADSLLVQQFGAQVLASNAKLESTGVVANSVGNKVAGGVKSIFGFVRQLAYILPGIGIAGIFALAIDPISDFISKMFGASDAAKRASDRIKEEKDHLTELVETYRDLDAIQATATGNTAAEVTKVETLAGAVLDQKNSYDLRNKALKELEGINKNYFGGLTLEADSLDILTKKVEEYTNAIIQQAVIKEVESDIGKLGAAYYKQAQSLRDLTIADNKNREDFINNNQARLQSGKRIFNLDDDNNQTAIKRAQEIKQKTKDLEPLKDQFTSLRKLLHDLNLDFLNLDPLGGQSDKAEHADVKLKAITKKFFDDELKDQVAALKEQSKNEQIYFEERISKRTEAAKIEESIINQQAAVEIQNEKDKLQSVIDAEKEKDDIKARAKDPSKVQGGSQNAIINAQREFATKSKDINDKRANDITRTETQLADEVSTIQFTTNAKRIANDKQANDEFKKFIEDRKKAELAAINSRSDRELEGLDRDRDQRLKIITDEENAQLSVAKTAEERQKVEEKAARKSLAVDLEVSKLKIQVSLNTAKALLAATPVENQDQVEKIRAQIAALEKQLADLNTKQINIKFDDSFLKKLDKYAKAIESIKEGVSDVFGVIAGAINASVTAQKNALQDQSDAIDKNSKSEIDAVNASVDTAETKAAKIAIIDARAQAQKEIIAQRQRQLDQRNAEVQKAQNIAEIVLNTAAAVVKGLRTGGLPLAILYGALGAAQLAVAIATPIPRFEKGTLDAPGGLAYVNEKRKELIVTPTGQLIETPGTPVVMNIPKHSIVLPDSRKVLERGLTKRDLVNIGGNKDNSGLFYYLGGKMDRLNKTIKNKTETHIRRKGDGWEQIKKSGGNQTKYLN